MCGRRARNLRLAQDTDRLTFSNLLAPRIAAAQGNTRRLLAGIAIPLRCNVFGISYGSQPRAYPGLSRTPPSTWPPEPAGATPARSEPND